MIHRVEIRPEIAVQPAEYHRLLGYPPGRELSERAAELEQLTRDWYAANGRPWVYTHVTEEISVGKSSFVIEREAFISSRLRNTLEGAVANRVVLVAVNAGPELEQKAQELWHEGKPDEYFFMETYGSAVVEYLTTTTGARLCSWAEGQKLAVLPHYSPGYPEWDISEQPRLLEIMRRNGLPDGLETLDSGA